MSNRPIRAAIVGGGIAGLTAAVALRRRGVDVKVFEKAKVLAEVGAGILVYPNALRQLERLGLRESLAKVGARVTGGSYIRMDGTVVGPIQATDSSGWNGIYGMHRADLLQTLAAALPPRSIHTDHQCTGFTQSGNEAHLTFANGAVADADVVIGADGINSILRAHVVEPMAAEYSGSRAYRGLIERAKLPNWKSEAHQIWMGDGKHFIVFPVRRGELLNYVGFVPTQTETVESWSAAGDRDQLAESFSGWDAPVVELIEKVETCFWWGIYDHKPLKSWTNGRLALLGDAAHAMQPHVGQGANQAVEDAIALAVFLEGRNADAAVDGLESYEAFRRERTDIVQRESRKNGQRYDSHYQRLEERDREIKNSVEFRKWLFDYDVETAATANLLPQH
jgi:salicylate hydroxylase